MQNRSSRDRAAVAARRVGVVGTLPLALAVAMSGVALAAPTQAGTSTPSPTQGGTSTPAPTQDGTATPAPAPEPPEERQYLWTPPVEYQQIEYRQLPTEEQATYTYADQGEGDYVEQEQVTYVAPQESSPQLHLPVAVDPVKPIEAPKDMLRVGDFMVEQSATGLSDDDAEKVNNSAAVLEAQAATFWKSVGYEPDRADKVAAASVAGGVTGGLAGAVALGAPAAALGAGIGVVPGAAIGTAVGPVVGAAIIPGVGFFPGTVVGPVAGGAIGAGVGAALLGVPFALAGGALGAAAGAGIGTAVGAGDVEGGPTQDITPYLTESGLPGVVHNGTPDAEAPAVTSPAEAVTPAPAPAPAAAAPAPAPVPAPAPAFGLPPLPALPAVELPVVELPVVELPVVELPEVTVEADLPSTAAVQVSGGGIGDGAATINTAVSDQSADMSAGTNWTSPDGAVSVSASGTGTLANFGITVPTGQITVSTPFGNQSIELPSVA